VVSGPLNNTFTGVTVNADTQCVISGML
jgi:hypothetical protein